MKSSDFSKHEENRVRLAALLADPTLQTAMACIKYEAEPRQTTDPVLAAARYHFMAGVNHVLEGLGRLTQMPDDRKPLGTKQLLPTTQQ